MKKLGCIMLALMLLFSAAACGSKSETKIANQTVNNSQTVQDLLSGAENEAENGKDTAPKGPARCISTTPYTGELDIDLTTLNSTMVYSTVNEMVNKPDDYLGKIVKMEGAFSIYQTEEKTYFACLIADAMACCSQGIEFELNGDFQYPAEYPELGADITVIGSFDTYYEGEYQYFQLTDATMV